MNFDKGKNDENNDTMASFKVFNRVNDSKWYRYQKSRVFRIVTIDYVLIELKYILRHIYIKRWRKTVIRSNIWSLKCRKWILRIWSLDSCVYPLKTLKIRSQYSHMLKIKNIMHSVWIKCCFLHTVEPLKTDIPRDRPKCPS